MKNNQLTEGWKILEFGDIANHISKRIEPSLTDLSIYVGLEHLEADSLKIKRYGVPSDVEGQKLLVKKGQIIFGKRRAYQRKIAVADWDCICSAHAMVLEANQGVILPDLLPFFMQSDAFMGRAVEISEGSLSPTIKWKNLSIQKFRIPNFSIQKKILKILLAAENACILSEQMLQSAELNLNTLFQRIFIRNELSFDIQQKKLKDICEFFGRGISPAYSEEKTTLIAINQKCIRDGNIDIDDSRFQSKYMPVRENSILKHHDICLNSTGTGTLGRAGIWEQKNEDLTFFVDSHVTRISLKKNTISPLLLVEYFNSSYFQRQLYSECVSGSTNQIEINRSQLGEVQIPIFGKNDELVILKQISLAKELYFQSIKKSKNLMGIKNGLLNKYWE